MSLRDQLLKSGLVSQKNLKQVEAAKRKQDHDIRKNKDLAEQVNKEKQSEILLIEKEKETQKMRDMELNKQRDLMLAQRENLHRVMQILNSADVSDKRAALAYYFLEGSFVRRVYVTLWQQEMLARGQLGIGRPFENSDVFVIIPRDSAKVVQNICPEKLLSLHELSLEEDIFQVEG